MNDALKGELVSFTTKDGLILHGFLVRPKRKIDKVLINVHGLEGTFYRSYYAKVLARRLATNGIGFLTIEQRGSYSAVGVRKRTGRKLGWLAAGGGFERFEDCVYDIEGAASFLSGLGMKKIFLEGHSTGCQKVTYYQYRMRDRRVRGLVLAAPCDDYNMQKASLGIRFGSTVKLARKLYRKDPLSPMPLEYIRRSFGAGRFLSISDIKHVESRLFNYELPKLKEFGSIKVPILAIFGDRDEHALKPVKEYMDILKKNAVSKGFRYSIIRGANHGFDGKENEVARVMVNWLKSV